MKYHIDTIPVWDAYRNENECPLCSIYKVNEENYIDSFLGNSVMEPDTRIEVNQKGFCREHFRQLYQAQNRLGLGLITHTHTQELMKNFEHTLLHLQNSLPTETKKSVIGTLYNHLSSHHNTLEAVENTRSFIKKYDQSCIICERLKDIMKRYTYTILYLWERETEFRNIFHSSKGFCLPHFSHILLMAGDSLIGEKRDSFLKEVISIEIENIKKLENELEWFTLKFDYRNKDKSWGNSKDALPRMINKLKSHIIDE